jgi:DNA-binding response OmpR family regulator
MEKCVLIVEDDGPLARVLRDTLVFEGYAVHVATSVRMALQKLRDVSPELVLLDAMLPDGDGFNLCASLRQRGETAVIMLTARSQKTDKLTGLALGADDYVTKPFSPRELAARVRTVLRRAGPPTPHTERLDFNGLAIDAASREVRYNGSPLRLTAKEFDLLWFLASHPRRVFSRDQLMDRVWGYEAALDTGTVTVHIRRLRAKIEADASHPRRLETVWGVGYRFNP